MTETATKMPTFRELVQQRHIAPEQACELNDYAHELANAGKIAASVVALRRAHAMAPEHPILMSCLGAVLYEAALYAEGEALLRRAVALEPDYAPAHGNLASVLGAQGKFDEAKASFRQAIKIEPDYTDAIWNYALCMLDAGDWKAAWPLYEARKARGGSRLYPQLPYPTWKGEDLRGKTLHVQGEQGVGDRTLFSRYLHWIAQEHPGVKIKYMLNAEDLPSLSNFMWGYHDIVEFLPNGIPWPEDVDYGIYLMSIPGVHGTTPDHVYPDPGLLLSNAMRHKNSVNVFTTSADMLKVGVCWTGNPVVKRNGERSIQFEDTLKLAEIPNVVLFGLQFQTNEISRHGADQLICDLSNDIAPLGFAGTAAVMLNLDLVITTCTSVAHVAGALNVPCWTLLNANPYWLWLRNRCDTVWYPNTRLFRQRDMNDWSPVLAEVKSELAALTERQPMMSVAA